MWELDHKEDWVPKKRSFWIVMLEKTLESSLNRKEIKPVNFLKEIDPENHSKDWCWSWSFIMLATRCEEPTPWKRPWCWERLKARGESGDRGWDIRMESVTQWTWGWANSGRQWRTGKPGMLQFMGLQRVGHDLVTEQQQQPQPRDKGGYLWWKS